MLSGRKQHGKQNPPAISELESLLRSGSAPDHVIDGIEVMIDSLKGCASQVGTDVDFLAVAASNMKRELESRAGCLPARGVVLLP